MRLLQVYTVCSRKIIEHERSAAPVQLPNSWAPRPCRPQPEWRRRTCEGRGWSGIACHHSRPSLPAVRTRKSSPSNAHIRRCRGLGQGASNKSRNRRAKLRRRRMAGLEVTGAHACSKVWRQPADGHLGAKVRTASIVIAIRDHHPQRSIRAHRSLQCHPRSGSRKAVTLIRGVAVPSIEKYVERRVAV